MTIKLVQDDQITPFNELSIEEKRYLFFTQYLRPSKTTLEYTDNDDYVVISNKTVAINFSKGRFFQALNIDNKFVYNKKTKKVYTTCGKEHILYMFKKLSTVVPEFEWIVKSHNEKLFSSIILTNTIVKDILLKKITNPEDAVKKYLKLNHYKNIGWKDFIHYEAGNNHIPYSTIDMVFDNPTEAIKLLKRVKRQDIKFDIVRQALSLGITLKGTWSEKRLMSEHTRMTEMLMEKELSHKSNIPLYTIANTLSDKYDCKFLNTELDVFKEGKYMHHCLYTNYYNLIKQGKYIAFEFNAPERFTLGMRYDSTLKKWKFDQAYKKYDGYISDESNHVIGEFIDDKDNANFFNALAIQAKAIQANEKMTDNVCPFNEAMPF